MNLWEASERILKKEKEAKTIQTKTADLNKVKETMKIQMHQSLRSLIQKSSEKALMDGTYIRSDI